MKEETLVEKAKKIPIQTKPKYVSDELIELALAYLQGEIEFKQYREILVNQGMIKHSSGVDIYVAFTRSIKEAFSQKRLKIYDKTLK